MLLQQLEMLLVVVVETTPQMITNTLAVEVVYQEYLMVHLLLISYNLIHF